MTLNDRRIHVILRDDIERTMHSAKPYRDYLEKLKTFNWFISPSV